MDDEVRDTPEEKSMDDTILETYNEINARGKPEEVEVEEKEEKPRNEKGQFAPKEAEEAEVEAPELEEPEVKEPVVIPPELQRLGLRKEEAEAFTAAPQALKDAFVRRSEEMHRGLEQVRGKAQFGDVMERAFQPYLATIQSIGATPEIVTQKFLAIDHNLRYGAPAQKQQIFAELAQSYGVDLKQLAENPQPQVDPNVQALQGQLQQLQGWIMQQNQTREQQEQAALNSEISQFQSDPSNKYFEEVRGDMAGLLQSGLATNLKDAYERAIYANPAVRARVLAEQQATEAANRKQESTQKAQAAKQAAQVNIKSKGKMPAAKPLGSMDDTIRETARNLGIPVN